MINLGQCSTIVLLSCGYVYKVTTLTELRISKIKREILVRLEEAGCHTLSQK